MSFSDLISGGFTAERAIVIIILGVRVFTLDNRCCCHTYDVFTKYDTRIDRVAGAGGGVGADRGPRDVRFFFARLTGFKTLSAKLIKRGPAVFNRFT